MAVEYSHVKVDVSPDENTRPIPEDQIRRTRSEFFTDYDQDYQPNDNSVFLAGIAVLLFFPLGLLALAVALRAHSDNKMERYREAKRRKRLVYLIVCLTILADCLIVGIVISLTQLLQ